VTERDIVKSLAGSDQRGLAGTLGSLASSPLITIGPEAALWAAFATMLKKKVRRLPVSSGGRLMGIITERDPLKWVVGVDYEPNMPAEIKKRIVQDP
jgi:CBS domain-containing protein